jgi:hypothetical protein
MTPSDQLRANLIAVHAIEEGETFDKELARQAITSSDLDMIVCRAPDGWPAGKCCMFGRLFLWAYHEDLNGKPWKPKPRATETQRQAKGIA